MIKYIIWDFDGVICDSRQMAFKIHNDISKKYKGLPMILSQNDYAKFVNQGYDESLSRYLDKNQIDEYFFENREEMFKNRQSLEVFSNIVNFIEKDKIPSIIITATYQKLVEDVLINNGYNKNMFSYILGRETKGSKAEKLENVCKELNLSKNEVIYIGDTLSDVAFCNNIGINIICVGYGYCPSLVFEGKNVLSICDTEEKLIEYICKMVQIKR